MELEDRLYSSTEVAQILGVSLRSIYRYLEEGKLDAEVKTATGRHRFSKDNVLNFLYPDTKTTPSKDAFVDLDPAEEVAPVDWLARFKAAREAQLKAGPPLRSDTAPDPAVVAPIPPPLVVPPVAPVAPVQTDVPISQKPPVVPEPAVKSSTEAVDWLAKFRAAREQLANQQSQVIEPNTVSSISSISDLSGSQENEPKEKDNQNEGFFYYASGVGGLKDLAHALHKSAVSSMTSYAFTLYAGMSLYKSIRPFSLLHAYVKPDHRAFFEKVLQLTPTDKNNAQLCLIATKDNVIFETSKEMHDLKVVSLIRLKKDLLEAGEDSYASELDLIQG